MAPKGSLNQPTDQQRRKDRNFLKQSSILTALAITPASLLKAAELKLDEKAVAYFEQVEGTDIGEPALTRYQRAIIKIRDK